MTSNTVRRIGRSHDIWVVCLYHHPSELAHLDQVKCWCREVAAFPAYRKWDFPVLARSLVSFRPYKALRFFNRDMQGYISRLLRREKIQIIHAQNFYTTIYVRGDEPCLRIHYKENIEGYLLRRYAGAVGNPFFSVMARGEAWRTLRYERAGMKKFHHVLSISPVDAANLRSIAPETHVIYQRAGVDLERYPFLPASDGAPTVLFTGTMSYYPNSYGILRFLREGWPLVRSKAPEVRLLVVGHAPPGSLIAWDGKEGVSVTGSVPEVGPYLQQAHAYLVPLWIGGGIRLKILEAMASGRAVVSTPVGCEGLEVEDGVHLLVAEEPGELALRLVELLDDPGKRNLLARNARRLVEERYNWDTVVAEQERLYGKWLSDLRGE